MLDGLQFPPERSTADPLFSAHVYVAKQSPILAAAEHLLEIGSAVELKVLSITSKGPASFQQLAYTLYAALYNRAGHYIFVLLFLCFFLLSSFFLVLHVLHILQILLLWCCAAYFPRKHCSRLGKHSSESRVRYNRT